jgi:RNA polymerase primary sigma factor
MNERMWSTNPVLITSGQTANDVRTPANAFYDALEQHKEILTQDEKVEIAARIQAGLRIDPNLNYPEDCNGTDEDKEKDHPEIFAARAARERMVLANLGLVSDFVGRMRASRLTYDELLHEGVVGLMKATHKYDPEKGAFSTIAYWWMHQTIVRADENTTRRIRLPNHIDFKMRQSIKLSQEQPGLSDEEVVRSVKIKAADYRDARFAMQDQRSLDQPVETGEFAYEDLFMHEITGSEDTGYDAVETDVLRRKGQLGNLAGMLATQFKGESENMAYVIVRSLLGKASTLEIAVELDIPADRVGSLKKRGLIYLRKLGEDVVQAVIDPAGYEAKHGTTEVEMPVYIDPKVVRREKRKAKESAKELAKDLAA